MNRTASGLAAPSTSASVRPVRTRKRRVLLTAMALCCLVTAGAAILGWQAMLRTGRTPSELLDYLDHRLQGHPSLQRLSDPVMGGLRSALHAPSLAQRMETPFHIPAPPPLRGPKDIETPMAPAPGTKVWRVGPKEKLLRIADAAQLAGDGDTVEIESGDYFGDVAVWSQKRLSIRGVNGAARIHATGQVAEGKAIWVIRNGQFNIANIDFIGAKAEDGNGAGIRLEIGQLRLTACLFWGNQMGLVTANLPHAKDTTLEVVGSEFAYSHVQGRWGHNLYVGAIDRLSVLGSYFHHASRGHLIKSRAKVNDIAYSRFTDESGGRASYEMNFPNGGEVRLLGNTVQQQDGTENGVMVSYGEEGYRWPRNTLAMGNNTLVNDQTHGGAFLRVAPGAEQVTSANNLLIGFGKYLVTDPLSARNDQRAEWQDLVLAARQDYRLKSDTGRFQFDSMTEPALQPRQQYIHPRSLQALQRPPLVVGADQRRPD